MLRLAGLRIVPAGALGFLILAVVLLVLSAVLRLLAFVTGWTEPLWIVASFVVGGLACVFLAVYRALIVPGK